MPSSLSHRLSPQHWVLLAGGVVFLAGVALIIGVSSVQSGWKSVEASDVTPLNDVCTVKGQTGVLHRYSYYAEGQTYYYDRCYAAGTQVKIQAITYDPHDPYDATIDDTDRFKYTGIALTALGLVVTIGALFFRAKPRP